MGLPLLPGASWGNPAQDIQQGFGMMREDAQHRSDQEWQAKQSELARLGQRQNMDYEQSLRDKEASRPINPLIQKAYERVMNGEDPVQVAKETKARMHMESQGIQNPMPMGAPQGGGPELRSGMHEAPAVAGGGNVDPGGGTGTMGGPSLPVSGGYTQRDVPMMEKLLSYQQSRENARETTERYKALVPARGEEARKTEEVKQTNRLELEDHKGATQEKITNIKEKGKKDRQDASLAEKKRQFDASLASLDAYRKGLLGVKQQAETRLAGGPGTDKERESRRKSLKDYGDMVSKAEKELETGRRALLNTPWPTKEEKAAAKARLDQNEIEIKAMRKDYEEKKRGFETASPTDKKSEPPKKAVSADDLLKKFRSK